MQLLVKMERSCAFLVRIAKDAEPVELRRSDEITEFIEGALRFTGEPHDERCSQRELGNRAPHLFDGLQKNLSAAATLHALEYRCRGVLKRHVNVRADFRMRGNRFQQSARDLVGIGVQKSH